MNRQELAHVLRAACAVAGDADIVVIGSQAILGAYDEKQLPEAVMVSREADVAFLDDPDRSKADEVEGAIGEMSTFHDTHRIYAEGVHIDTAELPRGWRERLVTWTVQSRATPPNRSSSSRMTWWSASWRQRGRKTSRSRQPSSTRASVLPVSGLRVSAWLTAYRRRRAG